LAKALKPETLSLGHCTPHVLVVERNANYGQLMVSKLQELSIRAKYYRTVDAFLELNCREQVDLVSLEIDVMDPDTLDNITFLRTYFGEGPTTRIVASSSFVPGAFSVLVEQRGADICIVKLSEPGAMVTELARFV